MFLLDIDITRKVKNLSRAKHTFRGHHKKNNKKKKLKYINSFNFKMPFFLKKTDDPARSWNIRTHEGLLFRNGLAQIYKLKAYIFKK